VVKYLKPIVLGLAAAGVVAYADPSVSSLQSQLDQLQARVNSMSAGSSAVGVHTNAALTQSLLSTQMGSGGNVATLMNAQKSGALADGVTVGGYAEAAAVYEKVSDAGSTNVNTLQTHTSNIASSTSGEGDATQLLLPRVEMNVVANMNEWSMGYFSFGVENLPGSDATLAIDNAFVTVGNLNQLPVYAFVGRNTIDFGSFQTVNFSTPSLNRLAFQAYGDQLGVGFMGYGFNGTLTVANDDNTWASGYNTYTKNNDAVGNYALNVGYGMNTAGADWHVGAGYLAGARQGNTDQVGAYDLNAKVGYAGFDLLGEFTQTTGDMTGQSNNKLRAWDLGADYNFPLMGKASKVNVDYSRVSAQYTASQWVVGFSHNTFNNVWMGLEYAQSKGAYVAGTAGTNTVYSGVVSAAPTSAENVSDATLLFDVQGVF
jgi:hypothetical protein